MEKVSCFFISSNIATQQKDGTNTTSIWSSRRNCYSYNDALQKHESLPDKDTNFFDIVTGVLQGDTLAPFMFILCKDLILQR